MSDSEKAAIRKHFPKTDGSFPWIFLALQASLRSSGWCHPLFYRLYQHQKKLFGNPEQFTLYKASYTAELVHLLHRLLFPFNVLFFPLSSIVGSKVGTKVVSIIIVLNRVGQKAKEVSSCRDLYRCHHWQRSCLQFLLSVWNLYSFLLLQKAISHLQADRLG